MRARVIGLFLEDSEFAIGLVDYWSRKAPQYSYRVYGRAEELLDDVITVPLYLLISDTDGYADLKTKEYLFTVDRVGRLVVLPEEEDLSVTWESRKVSPVNKYQPADMLLAEALGMREKVFPEFNAPSAAMTIGETDIHKTLSEPSLVTEFDGKVIGIYSPVGRCGKTRLALEIARFYAAEGPTLYLSLEMFSDMYERTLKNSGEDMSDILYGLLQDKALFGQLALSDVKEEARPVIVTAAANPEDITEIDKGVLEGIIRRAGAAGFTTVVLDVGCSCPSPLEVLQLCETVYAPVTEEEPSRKKWKHFSEYLSKRGKPGLSERLKTVSLPQTGCLYDADGLPFCGEDFTAFVRRLIWGD